MGYKVDSANVCVYGGTEGAVMAQKVQQQQILGHCYPLSLSRLERESLPYKSPTLFTLITQIGFPGDKGKREE